MVINFDRNDPIARTRGHSHSIIDLVPDILNEGFLIPFPQLESVDDRVNHDPAFQQGHILVGRIFKACSPGKSGKRPQLLGNHRRGPGLLLRRDDSCCRGECRLHQKGNCQCDQATQQRQKYQ